MSVLADLEFELALRAASLSTMDLGLSDAFGPSLCDNAHTGSAKKGQY
jgi:hypothetical protein